MLSKYGTVTDYALYSMGLRDSAELDKMIQQFAQNQNVDVPSDFRTYSYDELMGLKFKLVNSADTYVYDDTYGIWKSKADDKDYMKQLVENGEDITIVGIVQPDYTASASMLTSGIAYPASLTEKVMKDAADSDIVKQQMADPATNVLTGESFGKAESLRDFDLTSLFSIDTNALKNAFSFDADALDFDLNGAFDLSSGSFDLSSLIDFSDFSSTSTSCPTSTSATPLQSWTSPSRRRHCRSSCRRSSRTIKSISSATASSTSKVELFCLPQDRAVSEADGRVHERPR